MRNHFSEIVLVDSRICFWGYISSLAQIKIVMSDLEDSVEALSEIHADVQKCIV